MKQEKTGNPDHELENLGDFGKAKFDPNGIAHTEEQRRELDTERYYQGRDAKPTEKRAPGDAGNPENPESPPS